MNDTEDIGHAPGAAAPEFSGAHIGFDVIDRDGARVGTVRGVTLARTCIVVESESSLLRRSHRHAVHASAVGDIDVDALTISLVATKADVESAPEFRELDEDCEAAIARHYGARG